MTPGQSRALGLALAALAARAAGAQQSLAEALHAADRGAFGNRVAAASARAASAQALAPLQGVLPTVRLEAGYVRTTDPIGAFGTTLRQRAVTEAAFAPERLNHPSAVGNYQGGVIVEQPLFNADAWAGRRAAIRAAGASHAQEEWTRLSTRADVVRAWYGTILAAERVSTLAAASRAAHAHVAQAEAMVRQGLVTKSDALLASVRAGEVDAQLVEAQGAAANARRQLMVLLGRDASPGETGGPADGATLPPPDHIRVVVAADTADVAATPRADVRAADQGRRAASADAVRARSAYLPRLNAFARYDWNSANRLYAGDRNWTVGVMASLTVFSGAADVADLRSTASREESARAAADAARARAALELQETRTALTVALARLAIAEQTVRQSAEAHRIVAKKYDGGLASVAELLDAQAAETGSALSLANARYGAIAAAADRRRALGRDPGSLVTLEETPIARAGASAAESTARTSSR